MKYALLLTFGLVSQTSLAHICDKDETPVFSCQLDSKKWTQVSLCQKGSMKLFFRLGDQTSSKFRLPKSDADNRHLFAYGEKQQVVDHLSAYGVGVERYDMTLLVSKEQDSPKPTYEVNLIDTTSTLADGTFTERCKKNTAVEDKLASLGGTLTRKSYDEVIAGLSPRDPGPDDTAIAKAAEQTEDLENFKSCCSTFSNLHSIPTGQRLAGTFAGEQGRAFFVVLKENFSRNDIPKNMRHLELKSGTHKSRLGLVIKSGSTFSLVTGFNFKSPDFDLDLFDRESRHPAVRNACSGDAISIAPAEVGQQKSDYVCFQKGQLIQGKLD